MKKSLLCSIVAVGLAASICFPRLPIFAENEEAPSIIIYELGDSRVPAVEESDTVIHDLNVSEDCEAALQSADDTDEGAVIIYELGDDRVPATNEDTMEDVHILRETVARGNSAPTTFYNLATGAYSYSFSNVKERVYGFFHF